MNVKLFVNNLLRSLKFSEKILAGINRLLTQIAGAIEELVDVEVHQEPAAQEDPEASEEWLPDGVLLHELPLIEVEVIGTGMLDWFH